MSQDALVVGINIYQYERLENLRSPAQDAEAIAQRLTEYGEFQIVRRLPQFADRLQNDAPLRVARNGEVTLVELEEALVQLFKPEGRSIPDTALFFFSGHGLRKDRGIQEGYLATSDANPDQGFYGLSMQWLRRLLEESPVRQQIIWLDCCHSGELLNFNEAAPGEQAKARDQCFIAACREFEPAYTNPAANYSILSKALVEGLDPRLQADRTVTNYTLSDYINRAMRSASGLQRPMARNFGEVITLTRLRLEPDKLPLDPPDPTKSCPYKGLTFFDCKDEDAEFFFGRDNLTDQLLQKVDKSNFLAVLGASGSGKSSVVRAGLLYQLKRGKKLGSSDRWEVLLFRPGEKPLESLAMAFLDPNLSDSTERAKRHQEAEDFIRSGTEGLSYLIRASQAERVVLLADQFEEVFTLCQDKEERQQFFECLLKAVELVNSKKFCLVLTMRADFFGKCTEYTGLAQQIQNHQVIVYPMTEDELRKAILQPAQKVGLEVELELVDQMIADVAESPGSLPLLQYTLKTLWQQRTSDRLTLQAYSHLGGIRGTLQKQATKVFNSYSDEEKKAAKQIFLELTQLGEGTEDTRRQVRKQDLLNSQLAPEVVDRLIQKLAREDVRLLVTGELLEKGDTPRRVEVVDVAHEALIRHWTLLRSWLDDSREAIRKKRKIESEAEEWVANHRDEEYLLKGRKLTEAEDFHEFLRQNPDRVSLNRDAREFLQKSFDKQKHIERKQKLRQLVSRVALGVTTIALLGTSSWIWLYRQNAEIVRLTKSAGILSDANQEADALVESIKAAKALKDLAALKLPVLNQPLLVSTDTRTQVIAALQRAIYNLKEINSLEGHRKEVYNVSFSPDGNTLASVAVDGVIKLWSLDGESLKTIQGHTYELAKKDSKGFIYSPDISFSPDGKLFASANRDGTVKLWERDGKLRTTLLGHSNEISRVIFSPDKQTVVSASRDGSIKIWTLDGQLLKTIQSDQSWVLDISFSPDGQILASSGTNGTVKLWNSADGKLIKTFHANQCNQERCNIWGISFTPDGKFLATASANGTIMLWKRDGTRVGKVGSHKDMVQRLSFSPHIHSGNYLLASASRDHSVNVWFLKQDLLRGQPKTPDLTLDPLGLLGHDKAVRSVIFSSDGKTLASGSDDGTIKLWNPARQLEVLWNGNEKAKSVSFSYDGKTIASASHSPDGKHGNIRLWNWDKKSQQWNAKLIKAHPGWIWQIRFSPDGQTLASASNDGTIKLWSREGRYLTSSANIDLPFFSVSFSPDRTTLASGGRNNNVTLWQYKGNSLTKMQVLPGHTASVLSVNFSPDGQLLASADAAKVIKLWKREGNSWKLHKNLEGHKKALQSVSFSPDGKLIASSSRDGTVKLWTRNGNLINTLYGHTKGVMHVTFSPDSQIVASVGADKKVILWSRNGTLLHTFNGHKDEVYDVQFSPNGKTLASASNDGRVILWNLNLDDLLERGCTLARNYLRTNPSINSDVRSLCNVPEVDAKLLVEQGRDWARGGNIEEAIVKFKEAQQRGQNLGFEPKTEAERLSKIQGQIEKGLNAAKQGNLEEAADNFEAAIDLDSTLRDSGIEPEKEAKRLYALSILNDKAQDAIGKKNIEQAIKYYQQVKSFYPEIVISAKTLNSICRAGSDNRQSVNSIMKYCEDAVRLAPQNGKIRDSRGLARLFLQQDIQGAIADFEAFIQWTKTEQALSSYNMEKPQQWKRKLQQWSQQRQECIKLLRSGQKLKISPAVSNKTSPNAQIPNSCRYIPF